MLESPEIAERFCIVEGYRTHYVVAGAGPAVLLVHGVGSSLTAFQRNLAALARFARVYALDLPGHGHSEVPDTEYTAEHGSTFLCSFIEQVCGGPAALVGVSAGGLMCALAAAARPELVSRLVLVSSAGFGRDIGWTLRLLTLPLVDHFVEEATPEKVRGALERLVYDPESITADLVDAVYQTWQQPGNRKAFLRSLRTNISLFGLRRWRQHRGKLSLLALPVMIIWGRNDHTIPVKHAYRAAKRIAGARLHVFERCGHMPPYEQSLEFNRLVSEFLR